MLISKKGTKLVLNEMTLLLGFAHHRNIVKFLGFCSHREEMLLVFEFTRNGSLDYLLFKLRPTMGRIYSMLSENQSSSSTLVEEPMRDGSSSTSSITRNSGPTELANNGSSSGADIHLENEGLPKYRRLTHSRRIQSEDLQSYISSIQIEPEEGHVRAAIQEVAVAASTPAKEEDDDEENDDPTYSYDQANKGSSKEGSQTTADGGGG
ncbi:Cysteine-rich receptor-like protein kinase 11 [Camellia lanceoleosa]|uniref:Cysteine-rich receptor-like protein kinase 11 n=1 Tax=Camellia lanceoleosa TaxID=1840588 RepID=A0ACC0HH05_9ERIC|nr:Cysteine-rich receptor-like protein kinase 11 [Camellia lanceoleosa]